MTTVTVLEHEHLLKLIDLHRNDEEDSEESDKEVEEVAQDEFVCPCKLCNQPINEYYRYYYKCIDDSCDYSLHKFCAEVPVILKHISHSHPLGLTRTDASLCSNKHAFCEFICYKCENCPYFYICISCCVEVGKRMIYHPSHPHALVSLISQPISCMCNACGREHRGIFFLCTTCSNFAIHIECIFLPKRLSIQQTTNGIYHHTHPLTLSYYFSMEEDATKYNPKCRVCHRYVGREGGREVRRENHWIYKCDKCIYYAHVGCATSYREPFKSILSEEREKMVKKFKDTDFIDLLHLPFPDQVYSLPRLLDFNDARPVTTYGSLQHIGHHHELILVDTKCVDGVSSSTISSLAMCHNPMKKIQLLCNVCVRPITKMPFYKCGAIKDEGCNFALHEWCTRLPTKVDNHLDHPHHTLTLMSNVSSKFLNIFECNVCLLPCNGYAYGCVECHYYVDVTCSFIPKNITHKSHPDHLLSLTKNIPFGIPCSMCLKTIVQHSKPYPLIWGFYCYTCYVYIDLRCAFLLPKTITHAYDKHPMNLSYLPIENHKSEYFCEICENPLNPHSSFYHCDKCAQSIHSGCAPLILCCETETYSEYKKSIYSYINVKFGGIHKFDNHPHPLSFTQGIASDGKCSLCSKALQYRMILKCFECGFAADTDCVEAAVRS